MLRDQHERARLRPFLPHFFHERHRRAYLEPIESLMAHAVAMKVDFESIRSFDKAVPLIRPQFRHATFAVRGLVIFDVPAQSSNMFLETAAHLVECLVNGRVSIFVRRVITRRVIDNQLASGDGQLNTNLEVATTVLMPVRIVDDDVATSDSRVERLQLGRSLSNISIDGVGMRNVAKCHLNGSLHDHMLKQVPCRGVAIARSQRLVESSGSDRR